MKGATRLFHEKNFFQTMLKYVPSNESSQIINDTNDLKCPFCSYLIFKHLTHLKVELFFNRLSSRNLKKYFVFQEPFSGLGFLSQENSELLSLKNNVK